MDHIPTSHGRRDRSAVPDNPYFISKRERLPRSKNPLKKRYRLGFNLLGYMAHLVAAVVFFVPLWMVFTHDTLPDILFIYRPLLFRSADARVFLLQLSLVCLPGLIVATPIYILGRYLLNDY